MKSVVFVSNFMNHHQLPVALEMSKIFDYHFIATEPIATEQAKMGYEDMNKKYDFIIRTYEDEEENEKAQKLIDNADVVIFGSCPFEMIQKRIQSNKLTFAYSERIFKQKTLIRKFHPKMWKKYYCQFGRYSKNNYYLLCSSAFASKDYAWFGAFKNKSFKWGYFPEVSEFDIDKCLEEKQNNKTLKIVWCNRFVKYKHPEMAIKAGKFLKKNDIDFEIEMIGTGPLTSKIEKEIIRNKLQNNIKIIGSIPSNQVKEHLKKANICLLTADKGEGWGAVVNEALSCGVAVLCNKMTGSVPYLVIDNQNGFIYKNKREFYNKLKFLAENKKLQYNFSIAGYKTMLTQWNAKVAVKNFEKLLKGINKNNFDVIQNGPCSRT